jgi:hypothetical protein
VRWLSVVRRLSAVARDPDTEAREIPEDPRCEQEPHDPDDVRESYKTTPTVWHGSSLLQLLNHSIA